MAIFFNHVRYSFTKKPNSKFTNLSLKYNNCAVDVLTLTKWNV